MSELVSQPSPILSLYTMYRDGKLFVNRRYQRKLVWTLEEKQMLIESILKKYPIPAIFIAERENESGTYEIIDGLQRLHAIMSFIETAFTTKDGRLFNLSQFPTAQTNADEGKFDSNITETSAVLSKTEVNIILDYTMALSVMRGATEEQVNDVFDRINTYGHRLSDQERRQAGVQSKFTDLIRHTACSMRGDTSEETLLLTDMPQVSVDLPLTKHGYGVLADEVFWVRQGILRSTDLRDSMDEQCIADIASCIVGNKLISRTKDALDKVYDKTSDEYKRVNNALDIYGVTKFQDEFKFCIDQLQAVASFGQREKIRDLVFNKKSTNAFPALFTAIFIAFHESLILDKKVIHDYQGVKDALRNLSGRIDTGRGAGSPEERRKNIRTIKGLISDHLIKVEAIEGLYGCPSTIDIDEVIRRSEVELPNFELKQGCLSLAPKGRKIDKNVFEKVINTICAMANNGKGRTGKILIGVADSDADAALIERLDGISAIDVAKKKVVGVNREAECLKITVEQYVQKWKCAIEDSELSSHVKSSVLSSMDYHNYFGLGVIVITVPPQSEPCYVGEEMFWRSGDSTKPVANMKLAAEIAQRF